MENQIFELQYALDTFYFVISGAFVMWMAAGFSMLEAGLVRAKNTTEILTKNVMLFAIACTMYMIVGYSIMYDGGIFLSGILEDGLLMSGLIHHLLTFSSRLSLWRLPCPSFQVPLLSV